MKKLASLQDQILERAPSRVLLQAYFRSSPKQSSLKNKVKRELWKRNISVYSSDHMLINIFDLKTVTVWPVETLTVRIGKDCDLCEVNTGLCRMGAQEIRPKFVNIYGPWTGYFRGYRLLSKDYRTLEKIKYASYIDERYFQAPVIHLD